MLAQRRACLQGAGRDVSQADRGGGGQVALKRRTPIVTIGERLERICILVSA